MKIVLLEAESLGKDIDFDGFRELGEVVLYERTAREEIAERTLDADIVVANKAPMCEETLKNAGKLKLIANTATGYNNLDLDYLKTRGIAACNVAGYSTDAVAQHTVASLLYLWEKLSYYDHYVKSGAYTESTCFSHFAKGFLELKGKTWGILGMGAIGRRVAELAEAFGARVIGCSASGRKYDLPYEQVSFEELLKRSDVLTIHCPLNKWTEGILNLEAFGKMKKTAVLVNAARGPIIAEEDLLTALEQDLIAGAALDVLCREPMEKEHPLLKFQDSTRLLITPHIAWAAYEARERCTQETVENIRSFLRGEERNRIL